MIRVRVKTPQNTPIQGLEPICLHPFSLIKESHQNRPDSHIRKKRSIKTAMLHFPSKTPFKRASNVKQM